MTTRREKYRADTLAEVKRLAMEQLTLYGAGAISLNAIAKELGMTGPALFRYVGSRDELLTGLILDAYNDLADALWAAVDATNGEAPSRRLRVHAAAYRAWALNNPHRYLLLFGTPVPGYVAPIAETRPAAERALASSIALLEDLIPRCEFGPAGSFNAVLESWMRQQSGAEIPGRLLRQAIIGWTRLHGVLSLEIEGHFAVGLPDPALIYEAEVEALTMEIADLEGDAATPESQSR